MTNVLEIAANNIGLLVVNTNTKDKQCVWIDIEMMNRNRTNCFPKNHVDRLMWKNLIVISNIHLVFSFNVFFVGKPLNSNVKLWKETSIPYMAIRFPYLVLGASQPLLPDLAANLRIFLMMQHVQFKSHKSALYNSHLNI